MPEITPEQREAAWQAIRKWTAAIGSGPQDPDYALDALIAEGWGPVADAEAENDRLRQDVQELRDIRGLFEGWPTPIHMQDAMMEMRNRTWRDAEARGYRAGVEDAARECRRVAAEVLQGQVRPGQPRRVVTRPMARMAIRCAQRIRALADKPKETPHG